MTCTCPNPKRVSMGHGDHLRVANRPSFDNCSSCVVQACAQGWTTSWTTVQLHCKGRRAAKANLCRLPGGTATQGWGPWAVSVSCSHLKRSSPPPQLPMDTSSSSNTSSALLGSCCVGLNAQTHLCLKFSAQENKGTIEPSLN